MMKKVIVLAVFALTACGKQEDAAPPKDNGTVPVKPEKVTPPDPAPAKAPPAEPKKGEKKEEHVDERGISRSPEIYAKYVEFMETIGKAKKALGKDIEAKKDQATLKAHLKVIREAGQGAAKLNYLKDEDKNDELASYFEVFEFKMTRFLEEDWAEDKAADNLERLGGTCRTCHELWRE